MSHQDRWPQGQKYNQKPEEKDGAGGGILCFFGIHDYWPFVVDTVEHLYDVSEGEGLYATKRTYAVCSRCDKARNVENVLGKKIKDKQ